MATPNGKGGWDLTDEDAAEVLAASRKEYPSENTHDPLCHAPDCLRCHGNFAYCASHECVCIVAKAVRADERKAARERVLAQGPSIFVGRPAGEYILLSLAADAAGGGA